MGDEGSAGDFDAEVLAADFEHAVFTEGDRAVEAVEDLLSLAAIGDHVVDSKQPQVMAYRRLRKLQLIANGGYVSLPLGEGEKDVYPCFVGEEAEKEDETIEILVQRRGVQQRHTDSCIRSWAFMEELVVKLVAVGEIILT
jgi:hypothetical protein